MPTDLEMRLALQLKLMGLPQPEHQYKFHPTRRWRADLAYPDRMLLIELMGAVFTGGHHTRGQGYMDDCEKANEAQLLGYRVLAFTAPQVKDGSAAATVQRALEQKE